MSAHTNELPMTDNAFDSTSMPSASAPVFVATLAVLFAAIAALLSFDLFLARIDRRESVAHAANEYREGAALLRQHKPAEAADRFALAVATDRSNVQYALALGEATLEEARYAEAEAILRALLERSENDGAANLVMAHVMLREGRSEEAKAYFHRAVFGRWGADSVTRRRDARFELIDLLARRGATSELLAELLPLEDVSPDSVALRERLGKLFITAGSPARAANMFREVLRRDRENADAFAGMGDAALALGNVVTARADFAAAVRLRPTDDRLVQRLAIADTVIAIDPTASGLTLAERKTRSRSILLRTLRAVVACGEADSALIASATMAISGATVAARRAATEDTMRDLATALWSARPASCAIADEPLRVLHVRLSR